MKKWTPAERKAQGAKIKAAWARKREAKKSFDLTSKERAVWGKSVATNPEEQARKNKAMWEALNYLEPAEFKEYPREPAPHLKIMDMKYNTEFEKDDPVEHPQHYTKHPSGVECIQITEHLNFCVGNAVKYLWRAGEKGDYVEDLRKAKWYIEREIERMTKNG